MNIVVPITDRPKTAHKFLDAALLASARDLAHHLETEAGRPGAALTINLLVADIEAYREAFHAAVLIVNHAGNILKRQDRELVDALNVASEAARSHLLTQLKLSALFNVADKLHPVIDAEIEQRQAGGNDEDWAPLQALSDELHAAILLVRP